MLLLAHSPPLDLPRTTSVPSKDLWHYYSNSRLGASVPFIAARASLTLSDFLRVSSERRPAHGTVTPAPHSFAPSLSLRLVEAKMSSPATVRIISRWSAREGIFILLDPYHFLLSQLASGRRCWFKSMVVAL